MGTIKEEPDIHFEIGGNNEDDTTYVFFSSKDIKEVLVVWHDNKLSEKDRYRIDVWQDGEPVADITMNRHNG